MKYLVILLSLGLMACPQESNKIKANDMQALLEEINALSKSVDCIDASQWRYMPLGSKACGGPQQYIAYSSKIDTAKFIEKVNKYTQMEHQYNIENDIVSDCSLTPEPIGIDCLDKKAILKYNNQ